MVNNLKSRNGFTQAILVIILFASATLISCTKANELKLMVGGTARRATVNVEIKPHSAWRGPGDMPYIAYPTLPWNKSIAVVGHGKVVITLKAFFDDPQQNEILWCRIETGGRRVANDGAEGQPKASVTCEYTLEL